MTFAQRWLNGVSLLLTTITSLSIAQERPFDVIPAPQDVHNLAWKRHPIEGFAWPQSIQVGEQLNLYISVKDLIPSEEGGQSYDLSIYRLPQLSASVKDSTNIQGQFFPLHFADHPDSTISPGDTSRRPVDFKRGCIPFWNSGKLSFSTTGWQAGMYYAKLVHRSLPNVDTNWYYITFIIRSANPGGSVSKVLLKYELTTLQAYNYWGGGSLYSYPQDPSSLTPTDTIALARPLPWDGSVNSAFYLYWFVKVVEDSGDSVEYCNNIDLDSTSNDPGVFVGERLLSKYKMLVLIQHDEYWYEIERRNIEEVFKAQHGNIAHFAANTCYWRINRLNMGGSQYLKLYCRKDNWPPDSGNHLPIDQWRYRGTGGAALPEARFLGSEYETGYNLEDPPDSMRMPQHWIFKGTGIGKDSLFGYGLVDQYGTRHGIVTGEIDNTRSDTCYFPLDTLAQRLVWSQISTRSGYLEHQMVYYEDTVTNSRVFSEGGSGWQFALMDDNDHLQDIERMKRITMNIMDHFSGKKYLGKVYTTGPTNALIWSSAVELDGDVEVLQGKYLKIVSTTITMDSGVTFSINGTLEINGNVTLSGPGTVNVGSTGKIVLGTGARLTIDPAVTFRLNAGIRDGWNMTSIPAVVPSYLKDSVYLTRTSKVFEFTPTGYVERDTLKSDRGWWVKFGSDTLHSYQGRFIDSMAMHAYKGWNIIGSISSPVDTGLLYTDPPGIWSHIIFKYSAAGYTPATTLYPGAGYWTKTSDSGKVILNLRSLSARPNSGPGFFTKLNGGDSSSLDTYDRFTVIDANGNRQNLYVRNASLAGTTENIEMPPPIPDHSFDVRFSPGDFLQSVLPDSAGIDLSIALNTVTYPVHLTWGINPDNGLTYVLPEGGGGLGKMNSLAQSTSMTIQNRADGFVHLKVLNGKALQNQVPTRFALQQNYPNPFNPLTTINFDLPVDAHTHLKLYDVLGREVASLVDEDRAAGYHKASFDGSRFASGVYFYRLQTGSFTSAKKLLLLK